MESSAEVEAKLALPGPVYWRLRDDPDLLGLTVVRREVERQSNLFYDTPDGALRRAGAVLRARKLSGQRGVEWTLKSGRRLDAGIQTAEETIAWGPDAEDPLASAEGLPPVAEALRIANASLRVDAASLADRLLLEVSAPSGGEIGVSLDRLRVPGDPVFADYELEAEAHGAAIADVEALAAELAARFGLRSSIDSKRARIQAYADGQLGPPRGSWRESLRRLAYLVDSLGDGRAVGVAVCGLEGSPAPQLAEEVELELATRALTCGVSSSSDDWSRVDVRAWVASSVHWRLLRHLASTVGDGWGALGQFARRAAADRRELEWIWREADLVALADEPSVSVDQEAPPPEGVLYRPDDLPRDVRGAIILERVGDGSRLTFAARAWPADLATARHSVDINAPAERVDEVLRGVGYEEARGDLTP